MFTQFIHTDVDQYHQKLKSLISQSALKEGIYAIEQKLRLHLYTIMTKEEFLKIYQIKFIIISY